LPAAGQQAGPPSAELITALQRLLPAEDPLLEAGPIAVDEDDPLQRRQLPPHRHDLVEQLAVFDDDEDAASGRIRGLTGWEDAKVADPADDFATLVTSASPAALDSVFEAYAHARVDRPDMYLERRARLAGELKLVSELLSAVGSKDQSRINACADRLRRLDGDTFDDEPDAEPVVPTAPAGPVLTEYPLTEHPLTEHPLKPQPDEAELDGRAHADVNE